MSSEKLTLKPAEAAKLLNISLPTMYQLCNREDFPSIRIGRMIVISYAGLKEWLEKQSESKS